MLRGHSLPRSISRGEDEGLDWEERIFFGDVRDFGNLFDRAFPWHQKGMGDSGGNVLHSVVMTDDDDRVLTLLLLAHRYGHAERLLTQVDSRGRTPLELATSRQYLPVVKMVSS